MPRDISGLFDRRAILSAALSSRYFCRAGTTSEQLWPPPRSAHRCFSYFFPSVCGPKALDGALPEQLGNRFNPCTSTLVTL